LGSFFEFRGDGRQAFVLNPHAFEHGALVAPHEKGDGGHQGDEE
jgi:hypothetical protein